MLLSVNAVSSSFDPQKDALPWEATITCDEAEKSLVKSASMAKKAENSQTHIDALMTQSKNLLPRDTERAFEAIQIKKDAIAATKLASIKAEECENAL